MLWCLSFHVLGGLGDHMLVRLIGQHDAISIQLVTFAAQWMLCISQFFYMHLVSGYLMSVVYMQWKIVDAWSPVCSRHSEWAMFLVVFGVVTMCRLAIYGSNAHAIWCVVTLLLPCSSSEARYLSHWAIFIYCEHLYLRLGTDLSWTFSLY